MAKDIDPGDAVPPGVAPQEPAPLTDEDRRVRDRLRDLGGEERDPDANARRDRETEAILQTVQPRGDAPSRSGITGTGSGADGQGL
jgi:hypothetical protein